MQIVLAWLDEDFIIVKEGQPDIGRPHTFKAIPKPLAAMWLNKGTDADLAKAKKYAETDARTVFCYDGERDPLGRARRDILAGRTGA